jgi:hypothetical protein
MTVGRGKVVFSHTEVIAAMIFCGALVVLAVSGLVAGGIAIHKGELSRKKKAEEDERARLKERKNSTLLVLGHEVDRLFGVELSTIHETHTQDEIVRVVSLLAHQAAEACVNQDKAVRGEQVKYSDDCYHSANARKIDWSKARKLALQICPELKDRLPHFSEFEPLKSYNAEHQAQKQAKRAAAQSS